MGFFVDRKFHTGEIVIGQFLGTGALYFTSVILVLTALFIPATWIGLPGIVQSPLG